MQIIPAVDLMNSRVVRLVRGDPETMKSYEHFGDPVMVAKRWEKEGADAIHIIDLDAALNRGSNLGVIKEIVRVVKLSTQVGGGIRNLEAARTLLRMGVQRIILGALAFNEPSGVAELLMNFGSERVVVALDYHDDKVMVKGWKTTTKLSVEEAATRFLQLGAEKFLVTSITRDGTLKGPDYDMLTRVCSYPNISVIAAGGVSSLQDLALLKQVGVWGVVIGKALYEGVFELREALKIGRGR